LYAEELPLWSTKSLSTGLLPLTVVLLLSVKVLPAMRLLVSVTATPAVEEVE